MFLFGKKEKRTSGPAKEYDRDKMTPVLRCSICTGEQVAGFKDKETGRFREVMLIRDEDDLKEFRREYGITEEVRKIY